MAVKTMPDIDEFALTLQEDVRLLSEANGLSMEEAFFARVSDTITGSGEVDLLEYFHHRVRHNRASAWMVGVVIRSEAAN